MIASSAFLNTKKPSAASRPALQSQQIKPNKSIRRISHRDLINPKKEKKNLKEQVLNKTNNITGTAPKQRRAAEKPAMHRQQRNQIKQLGDNHAATK